MIPESEDNSGNTQAVMADSTRKRLLLVEDEAIIALGEKKSLER